MSKLIDFCFVIMQRKWVGWGCGGGRSTRGAYKAMKGNSVFRRHLVMFTLCRIQIEVIYVTCLHCSPNASFPSHECYLQLNCKEIWEEGTRPDKVPFYSAQFIMGHMCVSPVSKCAAREPSVGSHLAVDVHCLLFSYFSPLLYRHGFFCLTRSFSSSLKPFPKQSRQSWRCCRGSCWAAAPCLPPSSPVSSLTAQSKKVRMFIFLPVSWEKKAKEKYQYLFLAFSAAHPCSM